MVGLTGDGTASLPGFVGSSETSLQLSNGRPQRALLPENAESGKEERDLGISPPKLFPETLKS